MSHPGPWTPDQRRAGNSGPQQGPLPYGDGPNPGQPFGGQPAPGQPYGGQPAPSQPYGGQSVPGQPYGGQPTPGQSYGGGSHGGPPYGGGPEGQPRKGKGGGWVTWALIIVAVLFLIGMCSVIVGGDEESVTESPAATSEPFEPAAPATDPEGPSDLAPDLTFEPAAEPEPAPEPQPESQPEPAVEEVPREFQNAVRSAKQYLDYTSFSRQGLVDQLLFENYSPEAAQYAVDNIDVDWNEQAVKMAQQYLDFTSFSRQGLVDQLVFDGFTAEQAEYGVSQAY